MGALAVGLVFASSEVTVSQVLAGVVGCLAGTCVGLLILFLWFTFRD